MLLLQKLLHPIPPKPSHSAGHKKQQPKDAEDHRLFVRVPEGHPAQKLSPYALMLKLNGFLKENIIREIQVIKTGFAICPMSVQARDILYNRITELETYLSADGTCKVEKPTRLKSYLLSGIPTSFTGFDGSDLAQIKITGEVIAEALQSLTNIAPVSILTPRNFEGSEHLSQRNWVVLFPEETAKLSRVLPLFGVHVYTKLLQKKHKTPQCGKCFGWHNERTCIRNPRCRICGSIQHDEKGHTPCDPTRPHQCPPKCANCHGPHPADSLECLIRPRKDQKLPSKSEIAHIRQVASAARMRWKKAHCETLSSQNSKAATTASQPPTPNAPSSGPPTSAHNKYSILSTLACNGGTQYNPDHMNE